MFNRTKISTISGIVGWLQPANPDYAVLDATNLASVSKRYINENKFVKVEYLKDTQDYADISNADFNAELVQLQKTGILSVMDQVFDKSDYIDRQILYKNPNNKTETDPLPAGFVGYRISQDDTKNLAIEIKRDILEFYGAGKVTLVLFNSQKKTAVFTETVTISSDLQEVVLDWRLDNSSPLYKGDLFYGYFTSSVTGGLLPFKREYQNANVKSVITDLYIENIKVPTAIGSDIFDLDTIEGAEEVWGLNPDITVFYDYTDLILQNKFLFAYAIQLQCQIQALTYYIASLRTNKNDRKTGEMLETIIIELDGRSAETGSSKVGLTDMLIYEIRRVRKEINRLQNGYEHDGLMTVTRTG
jgi:hypothetical protein